MRKKLRVFFLLFILVASLSVLQLSTSATHKVGRGIFGLSPASSVTKAHLVNGKTETITYLISMGNLVVGKAKFSRLGLTNAKVDGKNVDLMIFETNLARFIDKEKIYSDPVSLLPVKIERDIRMWPVREKITESYDQENFILTITKIRGRKEEKILIKKDNAIHNAILLPFYVRSIAGLAVGWTLTAELPNRRFEIKLVAIEEIKVPAGVFKSYRFESIPKRFEIWISADVRRIPVKIRDSGAFGYTLALKEYHS